MDISTDHLLTHARERFGLRDYYGAAHLLEEVVATGTAFADVHHLLGLCSSLLEDEADEEDLALEEEEPDIEEENIEEEQPEEEGFEEDIEEEI